MPAIAPSTTTFENAGFTFRPLITPSTGSHELAVWSLEVPSGARSEVHSMDREETFLVTSGMLSASIGGEVCLAKAGESILVPAGSVLQVWNDSGSPATAIAVTSVGMRATVDGATFQPPWSL